MMTSMLDEFERAVNRFSDPVLFIEVYGAGVVLPARVRRTQRDGRVIFEITARMRTYWRLSAEQFELVTPTDHIVVPWGSVCLTDRATGECLSGDPASLKPAN